MNTNLKTQAEPVSLARAILWNAEYGGRVEGTLTEAEILGLHQQVEKMLATTNGDAGIHEISTRQLALLLASSVRDGEMKKALDKIQELLKQHPEFSNGNSKVHYCAHLARAASSIE